MQALPDRHTTQPWQIAPAVDAVRRGGVIAYPTEAVFGLGCDPDDPAAVDRLLTIKRRPASKGLILVAADFHQLLRYIQPLEPERMAPILDSWPGPYTWLLPARTSRAPWLRGKHPTLAVRVSAHPTVRALCHRLGGPIVSTSANLAGQLPARRLLDVRLHLGAQVDHILPGRVGPQSAPSEIRDGRTGRLLRPGNPTSPDKGATHE